MIIDGSKISAPFLTQITDPARMALKAQKTQAAQYANELAFEVEGELVVIPTVNIKHLRMQPAPKKLPKTVEQGTRLEFN
jgi:hypothetical protein